MLGVQISVSPEGMRWRARFTLDSQSFETDAWSTADQAESQATQMIRSLKQHGIRQRSSQPLRPMLIRGSVDHMPVTMLRNLAKSFKVPYAGKMPREELVDRLRVLLEETPADEVSL